MSVESSSSEGFLNSLIDESALTVAAANELTSPLVLLRQFGLALSNEDMSAEDRRRLSEQMTLTSERALRLAANLSMTSAAQRMLPLEPINPISICNDVIHELTPLFRAHGQRIELQPRIRIPLLVGNRRLLERILLGFGDNALYYGSSAQPIR